MVGGWTEMQKTTAAQQYCFARGGPTCATYWQRRCKALPQPWLLSHAPAILALHQRRCLNTSLMLTSMTLPFSDLFLYNTCTSRPLYIRKWSMNRATRPWAMRLLTLLTALQLHLSIRLTQRRKIKTLAITLQTQPYQQLLLCNHRPLDRCGTHEKAGSQDTNAR